MTPARSDSELDPFDPAHLAAPYELYQRLRPLGPAVWLESRHIWLVSGYDAVSQVLRQPDRFLSGKGTGFVRADVSGIRGPLIDNDPPVHTRVRRSLQKWFKPSVIEERRVAIRARVDRLVDDALHHQGIDAVTAFARPLPVGFMSDLLGLHHPDGAAVSAAMDSVFHLFGPAAAAEHTTRFEDLVGWLLTDGLPALDAGSLGYAIMADEALDFMDRVGLLGSIWVAGVDTTTNLISSMLLALAVNPDQWRLLVEHPGLAAAAVEEALRFESPVRMFMRRTAAPTDILGSELPGDADVCVLFASANRDDRHYPDPDRFDVLRNPGDHLAFGSGIHLCLGASLLRVEATELLQGLAARVNGMALDGDPVRNLNPVIQGYLRVPLRLSP